MNNRFPLDNETHAALVLATTERDAEITRLKEIVAAFERDFQDEMSLSQAIVERDVALAEIARLRAELSIERDRADANYQDFMQQRGHVDRLEFELSAARAIAEARALTLPEASGAVVKQPMNNRFPLDNETRAALVKWFRARATDYLDKAGVLNDVANALEQEEGNGGHLVSDAPCDEAGDAGPDPRLHP